MEMCSRLGMGYLDKMVRKKKDLGILYRNVRNKADE